MKQINKNIKYFLALIAVVFFTTGRVEGQSQWLDHGDGNTISLQLYKPFIPQDSVFDEITPAYKFLSGAVFLTGRYNLNKNFTLIAEIPFSRGESDDSTALPDDQGGEIGNPYLGMEYNLLGTPLMFEFGFRLPLTPENRIEASLVGVRSDIDRIEAFIYDLVPVSFGVNYESVSESNILLKARAVGNLWFIEEPRRTLVDNKTQFGVGFTLQTGYLHKHINVIFGLSGRYHLESGPKLREKPTALQYGLMVTFPLKNIRPGLSINVPGNQETGELFNYVIGLNCSYRFE